MNANEGTANHIEEREAVSKRTKTQVISETVVNAKPNDDDDEEDALIDCMVKLKM